MVDLLVGERQAKETNKAVIACNDYLRMGPGRSLAKLFDKYRVQVEGESGAELPPTKRLPTLEDWSTKFGWQARAAEYDAQQDARRTAEREREFADGLALDFERVRKLKRLADFLEKQIYELIEERASALVMNDAGELERQAVTDERYGRVWLKDVKGIGQGENFERVEIVRFNQAILSEFRAVLDDIAKETGGRVQKQEHSGPGGGPIPLSMRELSDAELAAIASRGRPGASEPPGSTAQPD